MNEIDKKTLDAEDNEQDDNTRLAPFVTSLALKTLIACLVLFSLIFTLVGCFSPKTFMNMYHAAGNDGMATHYAAAAVERMGRHKDDCDGTCGFSALLTTALNCAENTEGDKYADKKLMFAERYLALPCHEKHSAIVDSKYLQGNELTKTGVTVLSAIYGYDDYVCGARIGAMCATDYGKATAEITENIANATADTALLSELIAYTDFGGDYAALATEEARNGVFDYFVDINTATAKQLDGVLSDIKSADKRTVADIASKLSRLSDLAYNLNKADIALNVTDGKFTDETVATIRGAYKGFLNLFD